MKFKKLGNTDLDVSLICLGTMTYGEQNTQDEGFEQMDYAVKNGINFFDTAELYAIPPKEKTYGKTEEIIGNWFKERNNRKNIILASKIAGPGLKWIRGGGEQFSPKSMEEALNNSLKRLKTDYIDLYQLHWPERNTNYFGELNYEHDIREKKWNSFDSILKILNKFIDQGKIRYIGLSNETPWGFSKFLKIAEEKKLPRIVSVQNPYNLVNRSYEIGMSEISIRESAGLLAYSPLAAGYLTGKYRNNQMPKNSRMDLFYNNYPRYHNERTYKAVDEYFKVSQKHRISLTQLSQAFVNSRDFVTSNIIGATNMKQLKENIDSINISLNQEIMGEINSIHENIPNPAP
ncbi:MAG: aldo/keto reductase [Pelagibacteraceae bacterium TMED237]|nr:MAG: aldo/keto reductase [Pelagibacteraceae bacterium TMED237]|tara:strand:+ start:2762 stop:3802 length:1041 start_codon:yes stop_codon:yes gene_type:complete